MLDEAGDLRPSRAWDDMMRNEKPGGHGERSVAVGVVDMALHDLAAKIAGVSALPLDLRPATATAILTTRSSSTPPAATTPPARPTADLQDEMRRFLDAGYDVVKMKIGGAALAEDLGASRPSWTSSMAMVRGSPSTSTAASTSTPRWSTRGHSTPTACSGTRRSATRWTTGSTRPSPSTTRTRSRPARTCSRCRTPATSSGTAACGPTATTSRSTPRSATGCRVHAHPGHARPARLVLTALHSPWRPPVLAAHRRGTEVRRQRVLPRGIPAHRRLRRRRGRRRQPGRRSPRFPGIGFEAKSAFYKVLRELHR